MPAPPTNCGIIAGNQGRLYICSNADPTTADPLTWVLVGDLDNYSLDTNVSETNLNEAGWIRTLPTERGLALTVSGRLSTVDEGQALADEAALEITCASLRFWRFVVPGARPEDPPWVDWGFWAWVNRSSVGAGTTDPFTWGLVLTLWDEPVDLDASGQYTPASAETPDSGRATQGAQQTPQPEGQPTSRGGGSPAAKAA